MRKTFLIASSSLVVGLVMGVGFLAVVAPSQAVSKGRNICVDSQTKELKLRKFCKSDETFFASASVLKQGGKSAYDTWLELGNKGSKQDFINSLVGPAGRNGSSSESGRADGLGNCYQKLQQAIESGVLLVMKDDRDRFERETGCIVEQIKDETFIDLQRELELPVITRWERISMTSNDTFSLDGYQSEEYVYAEYFVWIENWQNTEIFSEQQDVVSVNTGLCIDNAVARDDSGVKIQQIAGEKHRVTLTGKATGTSFIVRMNLGVYIPQPSAGPFGTQCRLLLTHPSIGIGYYYPDFDSDSQRSEPFVIWEDPADMPVEYGAGVFKRLWGW